MVPSANSSHVSSSCMNTKHLRRHSLFLFPFCLQVFLPLIFEMYAFRVIFLVWYVYMYVFCRHFYQYSALQNKHFALPVELQQPVNDHFYTTSSQFLVTSYHFWEKGKGIFTVCCYQTEAPHSLHTAKPTYSLKKHICFPLALGFRKVIAWSANISW